MFKYDISILIPIYNAEAYLERTLLSVINQMIKKTTYEVLLINDGSSDNSEAICKDYCARFENFSYFSHTNRGVSATRNRGLLEAQGKYILFLDADDEIKKNTVESVFQAFETYQDEAHILAYPLEVNDGLKKVAHVRNKNFSIKKKVAVYEIEKYPYLNQCTMNVVIKNLPREEQVYFNEELKQSEDALFNTTMVLKTGKLLFCDAGGYIYHTGHESAVDKFKSPVDIQDKILIFFEQLFEANRAEREGSISSYTQSMVLYELNWRFKQHTLFPYHLNEVKFDAWMTRLKNIFKEITVDTILQQPLMDYYHKIHFIERFKGEVRVKTNSYGLSFYHHTELITTYKTITLVFNKIKKQGNKLRIVGYIKAPLLSKVVLIELELILGDGSKMEIPSKLGPSSHYKSHERTAAFYEFDFEMPIDVVESYQFQLTLNGCKQQLTGYMEEDVIFKKYLESKFVVLGSKVISYEKNTLELKVMDTKHVPINLRKFTTGKKISDHQTMLMSKKGLDSLQKFKAVQRWIHPFLKTQKIWLYNDRVGVLDNAYEQFKYDVKKKDGVKRYYVIHEADRNQPEFRKCKTVVYGSIVHKILFLYSSIIFTSFKERQEYSPLSNRAHNTLYSELEHQVIYLQHGILNAHTPWLYGKHKTNFDKFLISSEFEKDNLICNYGYNENDLLKTGMPRFDKNNYNREKKRKILLAPSWRKSLIIEDAKLKRALNKEAFEVSEFYLEIDKLINSTELNELLRKEGYCLDVKLHPIFLEEGSLFKTSQSNINILDSQSDFDINEYKLFVTDFSSFMFDFIHNKTKIVFLFPDYDRFVTGNHIYTEFDFDISQLGPKFTRAEELITFIKEKIAGGFVVEPEVAALYDDFYYPAKEISYRETVYKESSALN